MRILVTFLALLVSAVLAKTRRCDGECFFLIFCNYALSYWPSLLVWQYSIINPINGWEDQFFSVPRSKYLPPSFIDIEDIEV